MGFVGRRKDNIKIYIKIIYSGVKGKGKAIPVQA